MGASRVDRLREKLAEYHQQNPNKRPIGTVDGGRFVHLHLANEELEVLARITLEIQDEEFFECLSVGPLEAAHNALGEP